MNVFKYALHTLVQRPLFTITAVASIALGIGANATIFSVLNAMLLRTPPGVGEADRVVELGRTSDGDGFDTFTYRELLEMQGAAGPLASIAGYRTVPLSLSAGAEGERVLGFATSAEYFDVLGTTPVLGRFFAPDETSAPGSAPVAVLTHEFWQRRLGSDPQVIGRTVLLNRRAFTVVGVTAAEFRGHMAMVRPDVFIPLTMMPVAQPGFSAMEQENASWLQAIARLEAGATVEQANASLASLFSAFRERNPEFYRARGARAVQLMSVPAATRTVVTAFMGVLMALVGLILLVACANVAGMLLARAAAREREIAIRLALGAGRRRLIVQLLAESWLLFAIGGAGGVLMATWCAEALGGMRVPSPIPIHFDFHADARVLLFGMVAELATGTLFGLAPALQATAPALVPALRNEVRRQGSAGGRLRRVFVIGQVALTVMLLLSAGLFVRAMQRASQVDDGIDGRGVSVIGYDLSIDGYDEERGTLFHRQLAARLQAEPGVSAVGFATDLPLDLNHNGTTVVPEGWSTDPDAEGLGTGFAHVNGGYFDALQIPLQRGRVFVEGDRRGEPVVVVSGEFARVAWPGEDPLGRRVGVEGVDRIVVGVVAEVKNQYLMEGAQPMMYLPLEQDYTSEVSLLVRMEGSAGAAAELIARSMREADARLSTTPVQTLREINALGLLPQRIGAAVTMLFGVLALLLSSIGIYGVIAYMVAQRTREIGVRMALGADRAGVIRLVVGDGMRLALPGVVIGAVAGLGLGVLLRSFILGVAPADPAAVFGAPVLLLAAALIACWVPAARAVAVEPSQALRAE